MAGKTSKTSARNAKKAPARRADEKATKPRKTLDEAQLIDWVKQASELPGEDL